MQIKRATLTDVNDVLPLFLAYREFYRKSSMQAAAEQFLTARLTANESVIFLALDNEIPVGFTQLYPMFTSLGLKRIWVLNDLFVTQSARRKGVGKLLMQAAKAFAIDTGADHLVLSTEADNRQAQALYESLGYQSQNQNYIQYELSLTDE